MPQVILSPSALRDIRRLREFLEPKNPKAAGRAVSRILDALRLLGQHPQMGRMVDEMPDEFRELLIAFGHGGYVARYRYDGGDVEILAVRHYREVGFQSGD